MGYITKIDSHSFTIDIYNHNDKIVFIDDFILLKSFLTPEHLNNLKIGAATHIWKYDGFANFEVEIYPDTIWNGNHFTSPEEIHD